MAQAVINEITERVIRGAVQNSADALEFTALTIVRVGRTPSGTDFTSGVDYVLTDGQINWAPAGAEPNGGEAYFVRYQFQPDSSFKSFDQVTREMEVSLNALQPNADAKTGSVVRNSFLDVPGRQIADIFSTAERIAAIQSLLNIKQFTETELDEFAFNFNVTRNTATFSTGFIQLNATAIVTEPILIPTQTRITTLASSTQSSISFRTTVDATLFPGEASVQVSAQAEVSGKSGEVGANTITIITTPILGISSATNPNPTSGGTDQESNVDFAERLRSTFLSNDKATFRGIRREALEFDGVIDALVVGAGNPLLVRDGGIGGKVDVYIQHETDVSRTVTTPEDHIFDGSDIVLNNQPVFSISDVTINGTPTSNWILVKDTGDLEESTTALDAVRITSGALNGDTIGVTYIFNGLLNDIQDSLDSEVSDIPARDLIVRSAVRVFIDVTVTIVPNIGFTFDEIFPSVVNNIANLINEKTLGSEITYAEVFDAAKETTGVRDVRPMDLLTRTGEGTAETIQLGANEFPESGDINVRNA